MNDNLEKEKLKEAVKPKFMSVWKSVYNCLCRKCQIKMFRSIMSTGKNLNNMDEKQERVKQVLNNCCPLCKKKIDNIIK